MRKREREREKERERERERERDENCIAHLPWKPNVVGYPGMSTMQSKVRLLQTQL